MRTLTVGLIATLVILAGCSKPNKTDPTPSPSQTPTPTATATGAPPFVLGFGSVGAARVGMSKQEAANTGLFDVDVTIGDQDVCQTTYPLRWKAAYPGLDVLTNEAGTIVALALFSQATVNTAAGIGIGSTFADLKQAYGDDLIGPEPAGYGQSGAYLNQGTAWIGFLFDQDPDTIGDGSEIRFAETMVGTKPELMRDGC